MSAITLFGGVKSDHNFYIRINIYSYLHCIFRNSGSVRVEIQHPHALLFFDFHALTRFGILILFLA